MLRHFVSIFHLQTLQLPMSHSSAKANILRHQKQTDVAVLSADDAGSADLKGEVRGRVREFSYKNEVEDGAFVGENTLWIRDGSQEIPVLDLNEIALKGEHNVLNVLAGSVIANTVGIPPETIRETVREFQGVEHRLEFVRTIGGVGYVNDSIATAPERAIAAINAFDEPIVLLAGGQDKGMIWEAWAQCILKKVKAVVLFGDLAELMEEQLAQSASSLSTPSGLIVSRQPNLEEALIEARRVAVPGDVVLLSPGGTSFDAYKDFAQRGRHFMKLLNEIDNN